MKVVRDTGCTGMIVDKALIPSSMVIPVSSGSLQTVDHILIDVPLANVYLDSPYYKGHCKVMCVSAPINPVIIGNVKLELLPVRATTMMMTTKVVICLVGCSKRSTTEEKLIKETQRRIQSRSRKMITVLHKKWKVCCWTSVDQC